LFTLGEAHDSYSALARFVAPVQVAIEELAGDEVASAKQRLTTDVESAYVDLVDTLEAEQARIQAAIDDNSADNRELNGWILFIVTLAVPGSAVAVYFVVARRQMRAMQEWNRMEIDAERAIGRAKDSFIAGLSHELRTPLTSIYGFAEMMTDGEIKGPEAVEEAALTIATEAAEMARMVDDLLVASRLASTGVELEIVPTNVAQVVDAALTPFIRAGITVSWEPTTAYVATDGARLRHVLVNLLSNAVRHGGQSVGVELTEGDGVIEVEVWDDGPGVPDEHVDRLFDPYVHRDDAALLTGSVGLGLAVASRLAALLGGRLAYQRFGGKTYFVLTLPVSAETGLADTDEAESVASVIRALASS
jgi:signal transduction histidine kinase